MSSVSQQSGGFSRGGFDLGEVVWRNVALINPERAPVYLARLDSDGIHVRGLSGRELQYLGDVDQPPFMATDGKSDPNISTSHRSVICRQPAARSVSEIGPAQRTGPNAVRQDARQICQVCVVIEDQCRDARRKEGLLPRLRKARTLLSFTPFKMILPAFSIRR